MGIILEHRITKQRCVLLGPAYGMAESAHTDTRSLSRKPIHQSSIARLLAVANEDGAIDWVKPDDYIVVYVAGMSPKEAIQNSSDDIASKDCFLPKPIVRCAHYDNRCTERLPYTSDSG